MIIKHRTLEEQAFFKVGTKVYEGIAPGRMDVMGGIADYSGSLLLQMPISQHASIKIQRRNDGWLKIYSRQAEEEGMKPEVQFDLRSYGFEIRHARWDDLRRKFSIVSADSWHLYVSGCFLACIHRDMIDSTGASVYVTSDVPIGKGLSSSAAIECATLRAIEKAFEISFNDLELPILAQYVENRIVGAPCGLMDQLTSHFGMQYRLLPIVCQPASIYESLDIPDGIQFVGIDSGVKHSVAGDAYRKARTATFMGYSIIAIHCGASISELQNARESQDWSGLPFHGYLANIPRHTFISKFEDLLNDEMTGEAFLSRYKTTIDSETMVNPEESYSVKDCTAHPIFENGRIATFYGTFKFLAKDPILITETLKMLGSLMYASHESYSRCGLGHSETDKIVSLVKKAGPDRGLYGARISGGGSGGTVVVMIYGKQGRDAIRRLCDSHPYIIL